MLTEIETQRWEAIKRTFSRNLLTGGSGENDPVNRITGHLSAFSAGLDKIEQAVRQPTLSDQTIEHLRKIIEGLRAVPVLVEIKVQPVEQAREQDLPVSVESSVAQQAKDPGPT